MKKLGLLSVAAIVIAAMSFRSADNGLEIGNKAPKTDIKMEDVSGKMYSLKDAKKENGLLVIFSCNTCPFVLGWEGTYPELGKLTAEKGIGMILVNSNEAKRKDDDSMEAMKKHYEQAGYNTPYVVDKNHQLADAFGAKTTPHVYLFNSDMKLVYRGLINDKYDNREKKASKMYLNNAIKAMIEGEEIDPADTPEKGCSIKRIKA